MGRGRPYSWVVIAVSGAVSAAVTKSTGGTNIGVYVACGTDAASSLIPGGAVRKATTASGKLTTAGTGMPGFQPKGQQIAGGKVPGVAVRQLDGRAQSVR